MSVVGHGPDGRCRRSVVVVGFASRCELGLGSESGVDEFGGVAHGYRCAERATPNLARPTMTRLCGGELDQHKELPWRLI